MGFFNKLFGIKDREPDGVTGLELLSLCMKDVTDKLVEHFSGDEYNWSANRGEKIFECLVLSKFLLDHALLTTYAHKIHEDRIKLRLQIVDVAFNATLESTLSRTGLKAEELKDCINHKLVQYSDALDKHPHPRCWVVVASICTGIDHYENANLYAITVGSTVLAGLLAFGQDTLKLMWAK